MAKSAKTEEAPAPQPERKPPRGRITVKTDMRPMSMLDRLKKEREQSKPTMMSEVKIPGGG